MAAVTLSNLESVVFDTENSVFVEGLKLPKISTTVRGIFRDALSALPVPDLQGIASSGRKMVDKYRAAVNGLGWLGMLCGAGVATVAYKVAMYVLGGFGVASAWITGIVTFCAFVTLSPDKPTFTKEKTDLRTEIEKFKSFFTIDNCKIIERVINEKMKVLKDNTKEYKRHQKALDQLLKARGFAS